MSRLSTFLKSAVLASVATFAAHAAAAQDITVNVYEKGYFPTNIYSGDASRVKFVNKTKYTVGVDTTSGSILINDISVGGNSYLDMSTINGRTIKSPYVFGSGYFNGGKLYTHSGSAPDS